MEQVMEQAGWRDYLELTKPKVVALMLLTAVIGMFMAVPGMVSWQVLIFGNLGIALCAGSAAAVNHLVDHRIDTVMARTRNRPLAQGKVAVPQAIVFALVDVSRALNPMEHQGLTFFLNITERCEYVFGHECFLRI